MDAKVALAKSKISAAALEEQRLAKEREEAELKKAVEESNYSFWLESLRGTFVKAINESIELGKTSAYFTALIGLGDGSTKKAMDQVQKEYEEKGYTVSFQWKDLGRSFHGQTESDFGYVASVDWSDPQG